MHAQTETLQSCCMQVLLAERATLTSICRRTPKEKEIANAPRLHRIRLPLRCVAVGFSSLCCHQPEHAMNSTKGERSGLTLQTKKAKFTQNATKLSVLRNPGSLTGHHRFTHKMKQGTGHEPGVCRARGQRSPLMSCIAILSQCYVAYYLGSPRSKVHRIPELQ